MTRPFASIIPEIYKSQYIAIDCEFLGIKKELPVLKLLQVAVSKEKGYAIQVDLVGVQAITRHLKPVLENDDVNLIGWAYRGDAMAIECFIKDVELGSVLDLQAKLKPVAVEELSLNSAVASFATRFHSQLMIVSGPRILYLLELLFTRFLTLSVSWLSMRPP
ncbi:hypothetical protein G6F68_014128 [Rhizopus microsporus]|nr:hypothetical protein G6F68_014128 [Rhizopus microsporus]